MELIESFPEPVFVTQPLLPDINKVMVKVRQIWESKQLTNNGPMVRKLEEELGSYLKVMNLSLFSNGTIALQIACRILKLSGEVITTPFTFAATPHALVWSNLKPVFCDVENETLNMDPDCIEKLITPGTSAIMPVHVYGNPCAVEKIQKIADRYALKVIYDAAHAFGVEVAGKPIGAFGDISMFSLHATKVYHSVEGGALTFNHPFLKEEADMLRNFGIKNEENIIEPGTNGKMNELQAAIGLLLLEIIDEEIENRRKVANQYRAQLMDIPGLTFFRDIEGVKHNYAYFPIRIDCKEFGHSRDELFEELKKFNIFTRKYFYPLCSRFMCYRNLPAADEGSLPVAEKAAGEILVLPMHGRMGADVIDTICRIIRVYSSHGR
ncbi:MAG: DegT/DnrJ/EryC1/StrS family aminotransferase [Ruminiclostridium sp.]|nr:DegT/DnrJ/EryC1/StrS family aminotransferase [Ruminiclostridium sp.]